MCLWGGGGRTSGFHSQGKRTSVCFMSYRSAPSLCFVPLLTGSEHSEVAGNNGVSVRMSFVAGPFVREFYLLSFGSSSPMVDRVKLGSIK